MRARAERACYMMTVVMLVASCLQHAHASAPPGRYAITNTVVKDNRTGLLWQRAVDADSYTQADGVTYCSSLNLGGFASGWRLPTRAELLSIVDVTAVEPAIDASAFPNTPSDIFWTSSPDARSSLSAWVVYFTAGSTGTSPPTDPHRVRCLR